MKRLTAIALALVCASAIGQPKNVPAFVTSAKAKLTENFKDPNSAQYRHLFVSITGPARAPMLCGEVNGKNGFGAFIGFRRFYADSESAEVEVPGETLTIFGTLYGQMCADSKKLRDVK